MERKPFYLFIKGLKSFLVQIAEDSGISHNYMQVINKILSDDHFPKYSSKFEEIKDHIENVLQFDEYEIDSFFEIWDQYTKETTPKWQEKPL